MVFGAILAGLVLAVFTGFGMGYGAAAWFTSVAGPREGAAAMYGFFIFGPIGAVVGLLLGSGAVLRFSGHSLSWGNWLLGSGGVVLALGLMLMVYSANPRDKRIFSKVPVVEFELDYPADALGSGPIEDVHWTNSKVLKQEEAISHFFGKKCADGRCVVAGSSYVISTEQASTVTVSIQGRLHYYRLNLPRTLDGSLPWSEWDDQGGVRVRWRVVKKD
ncbi:hypothetical protein [Paludibaculum fermentans]|uniref:hypothetical protein n=1 Tax=Paludibaculum fermentans TaxID=1473598 RepID=UPI003EBB9D5F